MIHVAAKVAWYRPCVICSRGGISEVLMVGDYGGWLVGCVEGGYMGVIFRLHVSGVLRWNYAWSLNGCDLGLNHGCFWDISEWTLAE